MKVRRARKQRLKSLIEFVVGILVVFCVISFYHLGKSVIGPYLRSRTGVMSGTATTNAVEPFGQPESQPFVRGDMALIPDETTVTVEPIQLPQERVESSPSESTALPEHALKATVEGLSSEPSQPQPSTPTQPPQPSPQVQPPTVSQPEGRPPSASEKTIPTPPTSSSARSGTGNDQAIEGEPKPPITTVRRRYQVQVGVFRLKENTDKLMRELMSKGYQPLIEAVKTPTGEVYRIIVGAFDERSDAERLAQELEDIGIEAIVRETERR